MLRNVRIPAVAGSKRARSAVLPSTDHDDDVLLQDNREVSHSVAFFPSRELKYYDTSGESIAITSPPNFATANLFINPTAGGLISTPPRGNSGNERSGRRILIKNVWITGFAQVPVEPVQFTPPTPVVVWVAIVLDTQTNGVQCTTQDIFSNPITGVDYEGLFPPFRNMLSNTRYQVLGAVMFKLGKSQCFTIDSTAVPAEFSWAGDVEIFEKFLPLDFVVIFNAGTTSSVASVVDNSVHVMAAQSGGQQVSLSYKCRIRFADFE